MLEKKKEELGEAGRSLAAQEPSPKQPCANLWESFQKSWKRQVQVLQISGQKFILISISLSHFWNSIQLLHMVGREQGALSCSGKTGSALSHCSTYICPFWVAFLWCWRDILRSAQSICTWEGRNTLLQRREDMMSCRSGNLYTLITFQGQETWVQVTWIALWTKSRRVQGVFY